MIMAEKAAQKKMAEISVVTPATSPLFSAILSLRQKGGVKREG